MPATTLEQVALNHLSEQQISFYEANGYLHIPNVFTHAEINRMDDELMQLIQDWAQTSPGWTGPWRKQYMNEKTEQQSQLIAMHDLQLYSKAWCLGVTNPTLTGCMADLLGPNVELHHSTLHAKPPETGHPFPMHQDWAFYKHDDHRYVDVLVHLDNTDDENGCIRFIKGSHKNGALEHITRTPDGPCTPHLPTDEYSLQDTVSVPAKRGDVVLFNIFTIHGSHINKSNKIRRLVRVGYRDPENRQTAGQSLGRQGLMVQGLRPKGCGPIASTCSIVEE